MPLTAALGEEERDRRSSDAAFLRLDLADEETLSDEAAATLADDRMQRRQAKSAAANTGFA